MASERITSLLTILLMSAACASGPSGPPEIEVDRTACSHCTMLISEPRYAAAYQRDEADARAFDDIACLLESLRNDGIGRELPQGVRAWFQDGNGGGWIEGDTAVFVTSSEFRTPMGGGIIAYRDANAAHLAAGRYNGQVIPSLPALLARKEGQR